MRVKVNAMWSRGAPLSERKLERTPAVRGELTSFWESCRSQTASQFAAQTSPGMIVQRVAWGADRMHVEWQGDHSVLGDDMKQDFERELTNLGLDPSKFLVEVRREPPQPGADGIYATRYDVFISDLEHPDRDTWHLHGGHGMNWIEQFAKAVSSRR